MRDVSASLPLSLPPSLSLSLFLPFSVSVSVESDLAAPTSYDPDPRSGIRAARGRGSKTPDRYFVRNVLDFGGRESSAAL